jgi:1-acyl-sn-glycerol-3-phosphate acyltransferase
MIYGISVRIKGLENIDPKGHYIIVSNHASMFDIWALFVALPMPFRFFLKRELTWIPIIGWALKLGPFISVNRASGRDAARGLDEAAEKMRNGASVIIFAEGTRSLDGNLQPFKRGAFSLALRSRVPMLPTTINNSFWVMKKGTFSSQSKLIEIIFDKPIVTDHLEGRAAEMKLMEDVRTIIEKNFVYKLEN